jgi:hypothetical protein
VNQSFIVNIFLRIITRYPKFTDSRAPEWTRVRESIPSYQNETKRYMINEVNTLSASPSTNCKENVLEKNDNIERMHDKRDGHGGVRHMMK